MSHYCEAHRVHNLFLCNKLFLLLSLMSQVFSLIGSGFLSTLFFLNSVRKAFDLLNKIQMGQSNLHLQ